MTDVFGASTFSVRVLSPVIHLGTALLVYALGTKLYDRRVGFWASLVYALTPGTSFSATLFTTDVPLLFLWSAALVALAYHAERPRLSTGLLLGLAIGLGLNAKYMMIFLPACMLGWGLTTETGRRVLKSSSTWAGLGLSALLIAPNLVWNATHSFATFKHTQSDALWSRDFGHPGKMLEFIGAQFGILGPLLFAVFLYVVFWRKRTSRPDADRFLIWHSLPVLALFTVQAFISRANGNWAAVAFPAATVLVTAFVLERGMRRTLVASLAIGGLAFAVVTFSGAFAGSNVPLLAKPLRKLVGYEAFGRDLKDLLDRNGVKTVVAEGRGMTSVLAWELRGTDYEIRAFLPPDTAPEDHYQLTRPWNSGMGGPVIVVSTTPPVDARHSPATHDRDRPDETRAFFRARAPAHLPRGVTLTARLRHGAERYGTTSMWLSHI